MIQFLPFLLLLTLATMAHCQGDTDEEPPVLFEYLRDTPIPFFAELGCLVKEILIDRELSDHVYQITGGLVRDVIEKGIACAKPIIFDAMNNRSSNIGKAVSVFRMGNQAKITSFSDIFSSFPKGPLLIPYLFLGGLQYMGQQMENLDVDVDIESLFDQITRECHGKEVDELKEHIMFVINKIKDKAGPLFDDLDDGLNDDW